MDGVIADFRKAALEVHNRLDLYDKWPVGEPDIATVLEISQKEFWNAIDDDPDFWEHIEPLPWYRELIDLINFYGTFTICTDPSNRGECAEGKIEWLHEFLGINFSNYLIGHRKFLLNPKGILIDDSDRNIELFRRVGGKTITFPSITNSLHVRSDDPLDYVNLRLQQYSKQC